MQLLKCPYLHFLSCQIQILVDSLFPNVHKLKQGWAQANLQSIHSLSQ